VPQEAVTREPGIRTGVFLLSGRNLLVDALRGICFLFMTVDHLPRNIFGRISNPTYGPFGFFTAAPGFVFLSGITAGLVYERHRAIHGNASMYHRVLLRIRALYLTQLLLYFTLLAAVLVGFPGVAEWHLDLFGKSLSKAVLFGASLLYEPGYLGLLPMYCLFLALTPVVLWQLQKGNAGRIVFISVVVWVIGGLATRLPEDPVGLNFGGFNPLGYQVLFVIGLAFGAKKLVFEHLSSKTQKLLLALSLLVAIPLLLLRQLYALNGSVKAWTDHFSQLFSVVQLGPLRLLDFAAFALILYWVSRQIQQRETHSLLFRWLACLGQHSLPVFTWSILSTYAVTALLPFKAGVSVRLLIAIVAAGSLTIPAIGRELFGRLRAQMSGKDGLPNASECQTNRAEILTL
jgi:hypothetical protein